MNRHVAPVSQVQEDLCAIGCGNSLAFPNDIAQFEPPQAALCITDISFTGDRPDNRNYRGLGHDGLHYINGMRSSLEAPAMSVYWTNVQSASGKR
ncbi:MAG: hypothetical protein D3M94_20715 [Rhodocyclales bacterium GT-UBC]|nr:MAG: hypothetical protein D3M94_20715 [Rhodocyclales bacterium GT-UBC]